jgi:hypothetical protein
MRKYFEVISKGEPENLSVPRSKNKAEFTSKNKDHLLE